MIHFSRKFSHWWSPVQVVRSRGWALTHIRTVSGRDRGRNRGRHFIINEEETGKKIRGRPAMDSRLLSSSCRHSPGGGATWRDTRRVLIFRSHLHWSPKPFFFKANERRFIARRLIYSTCPYRRKLQGSGLLECMTTDT